MVRSGRNKRGGRATCTDTPEAFSQEVAPAQIPSNIPHSTQSALCVAGRRFMSRIIANHPSVRGRGETAAECLASGIVLRGTFTRSSNDGTANDKWLR